MDTLNPRWPVLTSQMQPYACTEYALNASVPSQNIMSFKLAQPTYVQYVLATGDGYDGIDNRDDGTQWTLPENSSGPTGACDLISNAYWHAV